MNSLLVTPKNAIELRLLKEILSKMKVSARELSLEEREDLGLAMLLKKANRSKKVSRTTIMKKLK